MLSRDEQLISFYFQDLMRIRMLNATFEYRTQISINVVSYVYIEDTEVERMDFEISFCKKTIPIHIEYTHPGKITISSEFVKISNASEHRELSVTSVISLIYHLNNFDFFPPSWKTREKWFFLEKLINSCLGVYPISFVSVEELGIDLDNA